MVSSAYLRLLMFLPAILIPACNSSSLAFHMMYSAYKLNKSDDRIQPFPTFPDLEPICCSMSGSNCCFLTCIQISQEAGQVVWYFHLLKNFPLFVVSHAVKGFSIVNEAEVDIARSLWWTMWMCTALWFTRDLKAVIPSLVQGKLLIMPNISI